MAAGHRMFFRASSRRSPRARGWRLGNLRAGSTLPDVARVLLKECESEREAVAAAGVEY